MKQHRRILMLGVLALLAVWASAGGAFLWARNAEVTAAKVVAFVQQRPLSPEQSPTERQAFLDDLAHRLNRLPYQERQQLQVDRALRPVFSQLSADEQVYLLEQTLPQGMKQMMEAFNELPREKRQQMVQEALTQMQRNHHRPLPEDQVVSEEVRQRIVEQGLKSYFTHASAAAKLDLQPLIEQIQRNLQVPRQHR